MQILRWQTFSICRYISFFVKLLLRFCCESDAEVVFAGGAPGQIGGVYQINVRIPAGLAPGPQPVAVSVSGQNGPPVQIFVR